MSKYTDYQRRKKIAIEDRFKRYEEIIAKQDAELIKLRAEVLLLRKMLNGQER
jgi:hypothetical protein